MNQLRRILLVEDSLYDAEITIEALCEKHLANEVVHVRDGEAAMDYLLRQGKFANRASGEPAVILMDLDMPKVNGLEALRRIKSDSTLKTIPVVVMSSSREDKDLRQAYEAGVNAYVVKPLNFQEFIEAVKQIGAFWAVLNEPPRGSVGKNPRS